MRDRNTETSLRNRICRRACRALLCALLVGAAASVRSHARAQEQSDPSRWLLLASAGAPLRLTLDDKLDQSRRAPLFGNVMVGHVLSGGRLRHGVGLGLSWNLGHDGRYTTPVYAADQFALMPSYLALYTLNPDLFALGHAGIPILVRGGPSAGFEVGAAIAYRVFAGAGVFAAIDLDGYVGLGFNALASLELGVVLDYEVLP
jgi:hypothetical protein